MISRMTFLRIKPVMIFVILVLTLIGCTALPQVQTAGGNAASAASTALIPLKVSVGPYLSYTPFYIAEEKGYFKEQGLDVSLMRVARTTDAVATLAKGDLDVASFPVSSGLLNAIVRGSGIKIVASKERHDKDKCTYSGFVVRKGLDLNDPSKVTPGLLKSLRWDVSPTNISAYQVDTLLHKYGLSLDDITPVTPPNTAASLQLLQQGGLDVTSLQEPFITQAKTSGAGDVWMSVDDVAPNTQNVVVAFGPTILKDNPDAGKRFMVAYLKGVRDFAQGMDDETLTLMADKLELDRGLVSQMCAPYIPTDGAINAQSIIDFGNWAVSRKLVDAPVTADMFWDSRFVDYANQVLKDSK